MIEGAGMLTLCAEMFGGCMTGPLDYSAHSWDGTNIALSGTDQFGGFSLTGVAKNGKTVMDKTYDNGMGVTLEIDGVPSEGGRFLFGNFNFTLDSGVRRGFQIFALILQPSPRCARDSHKRLRPFAKFGKFCFL